MRIVQLANFHGPLSGGIRTTLGEWRRGYRERGHETHLIAPGRQSAVTEEDGGSIRTVAAPVIPGSGGYRMITSVREVMRILGQLSPDSIEVSDRTSLLAASRWAERRDVRSVLVLHERLDNQVRAFLPGWLPHRGVVDRWNERSVVHFNSVVGTSEYGSREMRRIGVDPALVPLGVDLRVFEPLTAPVPRSGDRIVFLGRLSREKRPDLALEALKVLLGWGHDIELVFVGEGPMKGALSRASQGLPVTFTGFVGDRPHVASILAGADVSIAPCPGECFGLAALESLASGTPVVVAENSGAAELVRGGGGVAVPPGPRGFAAAIEKILTMPGNEMVTQARAVAETYPWHRSVDGMLSVHGGAVVRA